MATPANTPTKPYKAIASFVLTFAGLVLQAVTGHGDGGITGQEWLVIIVGSLVSAGAVYGVTNPATTRTTGSDRLQ